VPESTNNSGCNTASQPIQGIYMQNNLFRGTFRGARPDSVAQEKCLYLPLFLGHIWLYAIQDTIIYSYESHSLIADKIISKHWFIDTSLSARKT